MPDMAVATIGSGLIQGRAAKSAANTQAAAQERAAELAYEQSLPWSTSGLFGSAEFDEDTKEAKLGLDSKWQAEYDLAMADAEKQRGFISEMEADPMAAGKKFYEMQKAIYAPEQEKDRLEQENRLLAQGMLGSSGGAGRIEALRKAQAMQDLEAQYAGLDKAQSMIDTYRGRAASDLGMAETIGQMPQKYAETGRGIGTGMGSIAGTAAQLSGQAAQARGASQANRYLGIADQFSGLTNRGGGFLGTGTFPTFGTQTTGATTGGMLYGQAPMAGFTLD